MLTFGCHQFWWCSIRSAKPMGFVWHVNEVFRFQLRLQFNSNENVAHSMPRNAPDVIAWQFQKYATDLNFSVNLTLNVVYRRKKTPLQQHHDALAHAYWKWHEHCTDTRSRTKGRQDEMQKKRHRHYSTRNHQIALEDNCNGIKENYKHVRAMNVHAFVLEIEKALCCIRKRSDSKQRVQTHVAKMEHSHRTGWVIQDASSAIVWCTPVFLL